jgi:hypothetical protein
MRNPARELAQALQPLRLLQLAFQAVPLGLRPEPLPLGLRLEPVGDSRTAAVTRIPWSVSMDGNEISAGNVLPSLRRPLAPDPGPSAAHADQRHSRPGGVQFPG